MQRRDYIKASGSIAAGATLGVSGCLGGSSEETLEFWHDKGDWEEHYETALVPINEQLDEQYDGEYQLEQVPETGEYEGAIRPVLGSEDGPALFTWWVGDRLRQIVEDDYAYDITHIWDDYIAEGAYPEGMIDSFGFDDQAYSIPTGLSYWVIWYKPSTFDDLGVEPPETFDDFFTLCDTIQEESGGDTAPLTIPLTSDWQGFVWWMELVIGQDPQFYNDVCAGDASYTDEPSVTALETMGEMVNEGYFGDPEALFSLEYSDMILGMEDQSYAMFAMGDWVSSPIEDTGADFDEYDWFVFPEMNSDLDPQMVAEPQPIVPHSGLDDEDALDALAEVLMSQEVQQVLSEGINYIPPHNDVSTDHLPESKQRLAASLGDYQFSLRYWENAPASVAPPAAETMSKIFTEPDDPEGVAQEVEDIAQQNQ